MPTTANIIESFEDLGISLEDPKAIDRLVSLILNFGFAYLRSTRILKIKADKKGGGLRGQKFI